MKSTRFTTAILLPLFGILGTTQLSAQIYTVMYTESVTPTVLGGTLETNLPEFDGFLGTLTDVSITLNLDLTPYAEMFAFSGTGIFETGDTISYGYDSTINTITLTHVSDSWELTTPTVGTGLISGSGQTIPTLPSTLKLPGTSSGSLTESISGTIPNLADYIGTGTLSFRTAGVGQVNSTGLSFPVFVGGGGELTGTVSVEYTYTTPVPEPSTYALLSGLVCAAFLIRRRMRRAA